MKNLYKEILRELANYMTPEDTKAFDASFRVDPMVQQEFVAANLLSQQNQKYHAKIKLHFPHIEQKSYVDKENYQERFIAIEKEEYEGFTSEQQTATRDFKDGLDVATSSLNISSGYALLAWAESTSSKTQKNKLLNDEKILSYTNTLGASCLHLAVQNENLALVKDLVATKKFDINAPQSSGATPIYLAAEKNNKPIAEYLMQQGANPDEGSHLLGGTASEDHPDFFDRINNNEEKKDDSPAPKANI